MAETATTEATEVSASVGLRTVSKETRGRLEKALFDYLGHEVYNCYRSEEAWAYGTMSLEDFSLAREDQETMDSLVEIALETLGFDPQSGQE